MNYNEIIAENIAEHVQVINQIAGSLLGQISLVGSCLASVLGREGAVYWCGNGGSAADSQHLAAELVGRYKESRPAMRSIALTTDTSILTAVANDFGYADIFSRQLEGLGREGDVLVGLTTSGNSENVLQGLRSAKRLGMTTIAFLGKGGGAAVDLVDHALVVPSNDTARIQESHILIGHILCDLIERKLGS